MALTRSANKRPAPTAETGSPDSAPGKRRKVSRVKKTTTTTKKKKATGSRATTSLPPSKAAATSSSSPKKRLASTTTPVRTSTAAARLHLSRSSHGMRTRANARIFRFFDLPPEIRNLIYPEAYGSDAPVELAELRLSEELKVPRIFSEALPFFFENQPIEVPVMSNMCVRFQHLHKHGRPRYDETGQAKLPAMLQEGELPRQLVRFKQLHYRVNCCCCAGEGKTIMDVDVTVVSNGTTMRALVETEVFNRQNVFAKVVDWLDKTIEVLKEAVEELNQRDSFNGLTIDDMTNLATCFRDDDRGGDSIEHDSDDA